MQFIQCAGQENIHTYIPFTAQHEDALFSSIRVLATIEVFPKSADVPFGKKKTWHLKITWKIIQ